MFFHDAKAVPGGKVQRRETQVERDAALLLLLEPVGVCPGEGLDEGGLAVVDVTCCAENGIFHKNSRR
jgi:hypothetical protein